MFSLRKSIAKTISRCVYQTRMRKKLCKIWIIRISFSGPSQNSRKKNLCLTVCIIPLTFLIHPRSFHCVILYGILMRPHKIRFLIKMFVKSNKVLSPKINSLNIFPSISVSMFLVMMKRENLNSRTRIFVAVDFPFLFIIVLSTLIRYKHTHTYTWARVLTVPLSVSVISWMRVHTFYSLCLWIGVTTIAICISTRRTHRMSSFDETMKWQPR